MASFDKAIINTFRAEGGFQQDIHDNANYVNGTLIGTNRGISAQGYYAYYKKVPTVNDIKNLTVEQAKQIFKGNYWDKICGDFISNQSVAELMFQFVIGSGLSQISDIKDIANKVGGKVVFTLNDLPITKLDAAHINTLNQELFHARMKEWRFELYERIVAKNPDKKKFLKGWQNRLNTHKYIA